MCGPPCVRSRPPGGVHHSQMGRSAPAPEVRDRHGPPGPLAAATAAPRSRRHVPVVTECGERDIFPTVVPESQRCGGKTCLPAAMGAGSHPQQEDTPRRERVRLPVNGARRGAVRRARASSPWAAAGGHDDDHSRRICAAGSVGPPARRARAGAHGRHGGRRRRELLGAGLLRQPRGSAAAGRASLRHHVLSHARVSPAPTSRSRVRSRAATSPRISAEI